MIAVVVPCFRVRKHILGVLASIGPTVERIYVVDDACPEESGKFVQAECKDPRVRVLFNQQNQGVGGAMVRGYREAVQDDAQIVIKMDGDGQMDARLIPRLIRPIQEGYADYTKGNRFYDHFGSLQGMPALRVFGNTGLSFINKLSSGYWQVMDPTNGFTAIHGKVLGLLPLEKIDRSYFFESDMLFRLNALRAVVYDIPMVAHYGTEESGLRAGSVAGPFLMKHMRSFTKRIAYNYFLRDFNLGSVMGLFGTASMGLGGPLGIYFWHRSIATGIVSTSGTVEIVDMLVKFGYTMLLGAFFYDVLNRPTVPIQRVL